MTPEIAAGTKVLVVGLGRSGFAAADALLDLGLQVRVVSRDRNKTIAKHAEILEVLGAEICFDDAALTSAEGFSLVIASPGVPPSEAILVDAAQRAIPIWSEVELAWQLQAQGPSKDAPWLAVTGTNGKTTTVQMAETMLLTAGVRALAAGNIGTPILEAVRDPQAYEVFVVELSSFQLQFTYSLKPLASAVLNVAPDHIDWHGSYSAYKQAKARIYEGTKTACVYNVADPQTEEMVRDADVQEGARAIGFTLGIPGPSMLGVIDESTAPGSPEGVLADRAFVNDRQHQAAPVGTLADLGVNPAPHEVANALAAAALVRAYGLSPKQVELGLRAFTPGPHRNALVADLDGVRYIDDSKATNPLAVDAAMQAYEQVLWIAGGDLKGAQVRDLVQSHAWRFRGVYLLGKDRDVLAAALAELAPQVPVQTFSERDPQVLAQVVQQAAAVAKKGDVVLLSPAAASIDMFTSYAHRGQVFAQAVSDLGADS